MGCAGSKNAGDAKPKDKKPEEAPPVEGEAPAAEEVSIGPRVVATHVNPSESNFNLT